MRWRRVFALGACAACAWLLSGAAAIVTAPEGKGNGAKGVTEVKGDPAPAAASHAPDAPALEKRSSLYGANTFSTHHQPGYDAQASSFGYGLSGAGGSSGGGYGASYGSGGYGGGGGEGGYGASGYGHTGHAYPTFPSFHDDKPLHHHHHHDHHVDHHVKHHGHHKALALKGLLVPLAGVALLGAAAALVSNPILLQLGVISGKRRRRSASPAYAHAPDAPDALAHDLQQRLAEIALLERFMAAATQQTAGGQERRLLANYLSCSGLAGSEARAGNATAALAPAACLERVTCELHHPASDASQLEKHVMQIVAAEIFANEYISEEVKRRVKAAAKIGAESGSCNNFKCTDLEL